MRLRLVIPSLDYADFLAVTLPAWRAWLPPEAQIVVVTAPGDLGTREVACRHGAVCLVTRSWTEGGAVLNKARALEDGLRVEWSAHELIREGDVCLVADADVVPFGRFDPAGLELGTLYGCARYQCETPAHLEAHRGGPFILDPAWLPLIPPRRRGGEPEFGRAISPAEAAGACTGYFHAFRWHPRVALGSFPTAGGYDTAFRRRFIRCVGLLDMYVLHLGALDRQNWRGRVVPRWPSSVSA